jgi:hypothetical protein
MTLAYYAEIKNYRLMFDYIKQLICSFYSFLR